MSQQPYYRAAKWASFQSWLTRTIRKAEPLELSSFIKRKRENIRMQVRTWFKALVTDEVVNSEKTAKQWVPNGILFSAGAFRELRTELALTSLKADGKIQNFYATKHSGDHDKVGIDFWVELKPKGCFRRIFPLQIKSSQVGAEEFANMHIHYSEQFREVMNNIDPRMVQDFDSMGFDGRSHRTIPVIIATDKSITDLKQEILDIAEELTAGKKLIHRPRQNLGANNAKPSSRRIEKLSRIPIIKTLFDNQYLEVNHAV